MDYIKQTLSCVRRNNGFILLFLALVVFAWFEVIAIEKTVAIPNLSDNPLIDESMIDDVIYYIQSKRFVSVLASILTSVLKISLLSFVLYIGYLYVDSAKKQTLRNCLKVVFEAEVFLMIYRFFIDVVRFSDLDLWKLNFKERLSLLNVVKLSDSGLLTDLFSLPLSSINVISLLYCIILTWLVSRTFKMTFISSLKYVLLTVVLFSVVFLLLLSLIMFINA